jgi:DinB superfamily
MRMLKSGFAMPNRSIDPTVFAIVSATPVLLRTLFAQLPPDARDAELDEGWSVRHCLAHVLDTEDVIVGRMKRIVVEERPFIRSIDAPARLRDGGYLTRDTESLLTEFETRRAEGIAWLRALSPEALDRVGDHDEAGEISVADIAHQWAYHDLMHLKQAESIIQLRLESGMGRTRLFYFDV